MNRLSLLFNLETFCPFLGCCPIQRLGLQSCCRAGPRKAGQHLFILGDCLCLLCVTRQKLVTTPELQMDVRGFREAASTREGPAGKQTQRVPSLPEPAAKGPGQGKFSPYSSPHHCPSCSSLPLQQNPGVLRTSSGEGDQETWIHALQEQEAIFALPNICSSQCSWCFVLKCKCVFSLLKVSFPTPQGTI